MPQPTAGGTPGMRAQTQHFIGSDKFLPDTALKFGLPTLASLPAEVRRFPNLSFVTGAGGSPTRNCRGVGMVWIATMGPKLFLGAPGGLTLT